MKSIIIILLLAQVFTSYSYADQKDSICIKQSLSPQKTVSDSSILKKDRSILQARSFNQDYSGIKNNLLELSEKDKITIGIECPTRKKTVFNSSYSMFIVPSALISYGILSRGNKSLLKLDQSTNHEVGEHLYKRIPYDDYSQFAPAVAVYGFDLADIKAKHNFRDRTLIMATSYLVMGVTVQTMKTAFGVERPDGSNHASFPSGHTATAFVGAHILFKEYKDTSPWIGIGGYAVATATGTMRILNKKHWVSDVVTGAGVGILSAEIGYKLLPVWHNMLGIKEKDKSLVIIPLINNQNAGIGLTYTF